MAVNINGPYFNLGTVIREPLGISSDGFFESILLAVSPTYRKNNNDERMEILEKFKSETLNSVPKVNRVRKIKNVIEYVRDNLKTEIWIIMNDTQDISFDSIFNGKLYNRAIIILIEGEQYYSNIGLYNNNKVNYLIKETNDVYQIIKNRIIVKQMEKNTD